MRTPTFLLATGVFLAAAIFGPAARASSPTVSLILPRGVQRGGEWEVTFLGDRLADAQEVLFYTPGFEVLDLKAEAKKVVAKVRVAGGLPAG